MNDNITEVITVENDNFINDYLKEGWVILSTCTYYSPDYDKPRSAALMGKTQETKQTKLIDDKKWAPYNK